MKSMLGVLAAATVLLAGCGSTPAGPPRPVALDPRCQPVISLFLQEDPELEPALRIVQNDAGVQRAVGETRAQVYARFKKVFKDQPDLVNNVRPEALPPDIRVWPRGTNWAAIGALKTELAKKTNAKNSQLKPENGAAALRCQAQPPSSTKNSGR